LANSLRAKNGLRKPLADSPAVYVNRWRIEVGKSRRQFTSGLRKPLAN